MKELATIYTKNDELIKLQKSVETKFIGSRARELVATGVSLELPEGYAGLIWPRSGPAVKLGLDCGAGVIDSHYRGEIKVILYNHGNTDFLINNKDRIAQMILTPVIKMNLEETDTLPETVRGEGGFGSTGK